MVSPCPALLNNMMNIEIRQESPADREAVYNLNKDAFGQETEARLVEALRAGNAYIPELSLVAMVEGKVVGHILFSRIKIRGDKGAEWDSLALAPMAVQPSLQHKGIGSQLVRQGLAAAHRLGHRSVIVLGHEHFYPRFGFEPARKWNIRAPFDVPEAVFMATELVKGGLTGVSGVVEYHKVFY